MANLFAYSAYDQNSLDLYRITSGDPVKELLEDENFQEGELFFRDLYAIAWGFNGNNYASAFLGENISVDANSDPTGGVLQGYIEMRHNGTDYVPQWTVTGMSLSLTEVYAAAQTRDRADDRKFIAKVLADDDNIYLSGQNDRANGFDGNDLIRGGGGNDSLTGGGGHDSLYGQGGNDRLYLDGGNDILNGGRGMDWVHARGGADVRLDLSLTGTQQTGSGLDRLIGIENAVGAGGDDVLKGSAARNVLSGMNGSDRLTGRDGADLLQGHSGSDWLHGGQGRDTLMGGRGKDVLIGAEGRDILTGGGDADRFVFRKMDDIGVRLSAADIIRDFDSGNDLIDLRRIDASSELNRNNKFSFSTSGDIGTSDGGEVTFRHQDRAGTANDMTVILIDTDGDPGVEGRILLSGLHDLGAGDFLL